MTKPTFRLGLVMAALTLAACTSQPNDAAPTETPRATLPSGATTEGTKGEPAVGTEPCDLAPYRDLVGTDVKATSFPDDPRVRVGHNGTTGFHISRHTTFITSIQRYLDVKTRLRAYWGRLDFIQWDFF